MSESVGVECHLKHAELETWEFSRRKYWECSRKCQSAVEVFETTIYFVMKSKDSTFEKDTWTLRFDMASVNFAHLRLLLRKNLWLQLRSPIWLFVEMLLPLCLILLYSFVAMAEVAPVDRPLERGHALVVKEECILRLYQKEARTETEQWLQWMTATTALRFRKYGNLEEMKTELAKLKGSNETRSRVGLEIQRFDPLTEDFHYKLLVEHNQLLRPEKDNRWGPHLLTYGQRAKDIYSVQQELEAGFLRYLGKEVELTSMLSLPRPERIKMNIFLTFFYALMPGVLLLSIVATTRNIVVERHTIKPYLSVMGLNTITFYLSHCLVTLFKVLIFALGIGITAYCTLPNFPWLLTIVSLILFSFSASTFSAMLASFFTSPSTAMQMCVSCWLAQSITPYCFLPDPEWGTVMAAVTSLWPTYSLHYIFKFAVVVSNYGEEIPTWPGLVDSKWTGQITLVPLLMLIVDTALMIGITVFFEKRIIERAISSWRKKFRKSKPAPEVEKLEDADESFDIDDACADINLDDVFKEYPTGEKAVNGLSLKAHRGQVTVLLGHNGAGKTTTFSMICGVERSTGGSVRICGHEAGSKESRRFIGYCAQANTLIDSMTVKDHLWLAHGLKQANGHYWEEGQELMVILGLEEHVNKKISKLSGGQKRKLCVAMALIGGSQVILLDEPTAGMDPESRRDVETLLEKIKKDRTILLTTHYMDEAETLGDRIFIVAAGQTVCSGSPQFLKKRFGTGYVLTLVSAEGRDGRLFGSEVTPVIQEYADSARLGEIRGKQVEIQIPVSEQKNFPALFERLEADQQDLHISSFGLSLNSLEQVFLRVSALTEEHGSNSSRERGCPPDEALESLYEGKRHTGWRLYRAQVWAVLVKKFIYSHRFWSQLVTQLGLPVLSIIVGLCLYTLADEPKTQFQVGLREVKQSIFGQNLMQNGVTKRFEELIAERRSSIGVDVPATKYVRQNLDKTFYFGAVFESNGTTVLPNPRYPISFATAINTVSNAHLNSPHGSITASLETFGVFDMEDVALIQSQALLMMLLVTIAMCQFIVTLVEDRVSSFAHQQLLMGLKPLIYWLGEFFYCLVFYYLQIIVYVFSATFTGILTPTTAVGLFFLLILYYWATIPSVFVLSKYVNSSSRAALVHWILLFGSFGFVSLYSTILNRLSGGNVSFNDQKWNPAEMNGWELSHLVLSLLFPTAPMYQLIPAYVSFHGGKVPAEMHSEQKARIVFYCLCLFTTGAANLLIFLLVQLRHIRYFIYRIFCLPFRRRHVPPNMLSSVEKTSDEEQMMLKTDDLCKVYGSNCALAHLTMSVKEKECFGLLGVSGAGKTTAFNIITGQMFSTQGSAWVDGTDCKKDLVLGFCPQFDAIHKDFTGREALTLLARIHGYPRPKETADELIDIVEMSKHARKRMSRCSGGQRRRISVAASLLPRKSRIVILDEATAGIDPKARRDIWEVLSSVREHSAILMTSHSMDECEALCSRIGILKQGGLAACGSSQALKSQYGNFYTLTMALPSSDMRFEVTAAVADWFPGSVLKSDGFSLHLKWQVPKKSDDCWSSVFASCIELSGRIDVPDFCLTQSTLQDIFLLLAGENSTISSSRKESEYKITVSSK